MMSEFIFKMNGGQQDYTPAAAKSAGEIVQWDDGRAAVVKTDLAADALGAVYLAGIGDVLAASGTTFVVGEDVYWDASANVAINVASAGAGDFRIGTAVAAKASGTTVVRVDLNAPRGGQRGVFTSRVHEFDHADTDGVYLIDAADNPKGLVLVSLLGEVTEAPVGDSEDQLVVTLYDEDDNAIDTLTTTDGTPDAIGDVVIGATSLYGASTGAVLKKIPAGKAAYAKVTQATAGTGVAGKLKVRAIVAPLV